MKSKIFYLFIFICFTKLMGFIFFPFFLKTSPLLLIILSPFLHHLMLTSTLISPILFLFSGIIVSIFQCSVGYEFGIKHGVSGLKWMEKHRLTAGSKIDLLTQWLQYSSALILFLIPGPLVALVAGVSRLAPKKFYAIMIPSQIIWIIACFYLGVELKLYLTVAKSYIVENGIFITCILIVIKLLQTWKKKSEH